MFHKNAANSLRGNFTGLHSGAGGNLEAAAGTGPQLVTGRTVPAHKASALPELIAIASRRCSSFFAEAAVLVLVFGILDFFLQRGHMEMAWVAGALIISVGLLAASVATDFTARRWLGAQP